MTDSNRFEEWARRQIEGTPDKSSAGTVHVAHEGKDRWVVRGRGPTMTFKSYDQAKLEIRHRQPLARI
jgi:hypothetical protein